MVLGVPILKHLRVYVTLQVLLLLIRLTIWWLFFCIMTVVFIFCKDVWIGCHLNVMI